MHTARPTEQMFLWSLFVQALMIARIWQSQIASVRGNKAGWAERSIVESCYLVKKVEGSEDNQIYRGW